MTLGFDARKTALVLIDLQNGTLGMVGAPYSPAQVVEKAAALGAACKAHGMPIVLVHVGWSPDGADRLKQPVDAPGPGGALPSDWTAFVPAIKALDAEITIMKRQWGAFHGTEMDLQLRRRGIETIILGGVSTSIGVDTTAREAWQHNYNVVIAEDATTCFDTAMHNMAVTKIFPRIARVRRTDEIIAALGKPSK